MFILIDKYSNIKAVSNHPIKSNNLKTVSCNSSAGPEIIGKKLALGKAKTIEECKIAVICNWGDRCGIATYTSFLLNSLKKYIPNIEIFAEEVKDPLCEGAVRCWKRGESMKKVANLIMEWKPDLVWIQHEFGLFKATCLLQLVDMLQDFPCIFTNHSVYEHLDKTICTSAMKNIIVHTEEGKNKLRDTGNLSNIYVIPHGCLLFDDVRELWNIFQTDQAIVQFGFGFRYKGVDRAIDAITFLIKTYPDKYKNLFYCYLCSENPHTKLTQDEYYYYLKDKIQKAEMEDHIAIVRNFLSEETIHNYLRTAKLAIFPYTTDENNVVYGASGAVRMAMSNKIPVIASNSHLFDDLEGIVPRIANSQELAIQIDKIFTNLEYRQEIIDKSATFVSENTWDMVAQKHVKVFEDILLSNESGKVRVDELDN